MEGNPVEGLAAGGRHGSHVRKAAAGRQWPPQLACAVLFEAGTWRKQRGVRDAERGVAELPGVICQHDFEGSRIFQHRGRAKWTVSRKNPRVPGFIGEEWAISFLDRLRGRWGGGRG
jgi:hypothetical protein